VDTNLSLRVRKAKALQSAWAAIRRNARNSKSLDTAKEIEAFEANASTHLERLSRQLFQKKFIFRPARGVKIPKGTDKSSFRPLVVAKVESRIVQRAIHDVLISLPSIQKFTLTPYSFGGVKKLHNEDMAAVPAAIKAVLEGIGDGARFVIRSDIAKFFTRIPKSDVTTIVSNAVDDPEFLELFKQAISVELENMAQLREHARAFPIEDIGVAQGNSLSPLLGNLFLYDFDLELNSTPGVKCIRYIDDFIILAPNRDNAETAFAKAVSILRKRGMSVSPDKTQRSTTEKGFEFLGISLSNGFISPSKKAQQRLLTSIETTFKSSRDAIREHHRVGVLIKPFSLLECLTKVRGIMRGWGKHYRFCNDSLCFKRLDQQISDLLRQYLAAYKEERAKLDDAGRWRILGIEALAEIDREPFLWPKKRSRDI
jgi:RNA-directed DNA polymerase